MTHPRSSPGTIDRASRAFTWAIDTFGEVARDPQERALRFLEEAVELAHALDVSRVTLTAIARRVYDKPQGEVAREVGQAQMTLELLAKAIHVDVDEEATKEFYRIQTIPKSEWTRRHSAKQAIGIALPCPQDIEAAPK